MAVAENSHGARHAANPQAHVGDAGVGNGGDGAPDQQHVSGRLEQRELAGRAQTGLHRVAPEHVGGQQRRLLFGQFGALRPEAERRLRVSHGGVDGADGGGDDGADDDDGPPVNNVLTLERHDH